ncbi:MAG: zinc ribbon domain-containing protein [Thermodesulfobacteriota bacterium]
MREQINALEKLQNIDTKLRDIEKNLEHYPKEISVFNDELQNKKEAIEDQKKSLQELEDLKIKLEQGLKDNLSTIKKAENRLFEIKTHKEYEALQKEITETKRGNSSLEDQILGIMEESEILNDNIIKNEEDFSIINKDYSQKISEFQKLIEELEVSHKPVKEEKNKITAAVDPDILPVYERAAKRNGDALALARDEFCTSCHINLPPQLYNELLTETKIILCPSCRRILYTEQKKDSE